MSRSDKKPEHEYTEGEQQQSFIGRRMQAFAERSRDPGDGATWAVVLGALMCTLLVICYSVAGQPLMALISLGLAIVWGGVVTRLGGVNIFSILWGSSTSDLDVPPNDAVIFQATIALALFAMVSIAVDAFRGWGFGWYGYALLLAAVVYIVIYARTWLTVAR